MQENQKAHNIYNINSIGTAHFHHYGEKKIKHLLTDPPFIPELFLGRDADLQEIHDRMFAPQGHLLLLVNGDGGIGKTSLASQYLHTYHEEYAHVAWVFSERSIAAALLQLAIPLDLQFDERADTLQRLQVLIPAMFELNKPCLLVIDNANELRDLRQYLPHLQRCSNFHILFTTRISDFPQLPSYKIEPLSQDRALQVFKAHYPAFEPQEEALFYEIYAAVQGNTLVLELLAKNLHNFNNKLKKNYLLADLRRDLERGLLQLNKTSAVDIRYQAQSTGLRYEKIEVIIAAMYDLGELSAAEVQALSIFAVLPAESIPFERLEALNLGLEAQDTTLLTLAQKGWLEYNEAAASFKCSPVVQEVVRLKNENLLEDCRVLIRGVTDKLYYEGGIGHLLNATYTEAILWARWATALLAAPFGTDNSIAILYGRLGTYHQTTGNLRQALIFFEKETKMFEAFNASYPDNEEFKNGLANSYSKLGDTQSSLGNLKKALSYFKKKSRICKKLCMHYPCNVSFKYELAISYERIGDTYRDLGDFQNALIFFDKNLELSKELYESNPQKVNFKYGLAISYERLGGIQLAQANLQQALTFFKIQNQLIFELYSSYPENVAFKNGLAISYQFLGILNSSLSNFSQALVFFKQYNCFQKELNESYPENVSFKNSLAISYARLGQTQIDIGDFRHALLSFKEWNRIAQELYTAFSDNVFYKNGLAASYLLLGEFLEQKIQNPEEAQENYQASRELLEELVDSFPDYVEFQNNLDKVKEYLRA